jgi:hypothetical protein
MQTQEMVWSDWLQMTCYAFDPFDHVCPRRGVEAVRAICEWFLETFPLMPDCGFGGDTPGGDHDVASLRWLCQTILDELAWEAKAKHKGKGE